MMHSQKSAVASARPLPPGSEAGQDNAAQDRARAGPHHALPLIVDLDGTLTPTDTLVELTIKAVKREPLTLLKLPLWLCKSRAQFKQAMAAQAGDDFNAAHLPYDEELLAYLKAEKSTGRMLVLATAADRRIAHSVAAHLGLFDVVLASDGCDNLKGERKRLMIERSVGRPFAYAGDHAADLPIWKSAAAAILVGVSPHIERIVREHCPVEQRFAKTRAGLKTWMRALRVHQWVKNVLLFVPLLTAFSLFDLGKMSTMALAFLGFSLVASASYIVNDLLDLDSDRVHPRKRLRPFASAQISPQAGAMVSLTALAVGLALAAFISAQLLFIIVCYLALTSAYTWLLKRYVLIDVVTLSVLYTLRIVAGSVAAGVAVSAWLLAFSIFIFFSLALVKRCSELVSLRQSGRALAKGRDYKVDDLPVLWPLGVGAALSAMVVFGIFINAEETQLRYESPQLLWGVVIVMMYWMARLWIKTGRGEMHDDPIVYSIRNFNSLVCILAMASITMVAQFLAVRMPG